MARSISRGKVFEPHAGMAQNGIAVIFDLEGFSRFFNQPDAHEYIPIYLNIVTEAVETSYFGGTEYWIDKNEVGDALSILPVHKKFLGDGALYIWALRKKGQSFSEAFVALLTNRLWNIQNSFRHIKRASAEKVPVFELPPRIRFGLARGTVHELSVKGSTEKEYIGVCINLASRLQKYCPDLTFIASARLRFSDRILEEYGYIKVVATKLRGFSKEIVIVDKNEYDDLDDNIKEELFMKFSD